MITQIYRTWNYTCKGVVWYRGVSTERVVVYYKHSRPGVFKPGGSTLCVDATRMVVIHGNNLDAATDTTNKAG